MKDSTKRFLQFNGKNIYFVSSNGQYWVAIRPICKAIKVDFERQRQNLRNDTFLSQLPAIQQVVAADGKMRKLLCLPERYVYGWLLTIQSSSEELKSYKRECYDLLFEFFNGTITQRSTILKGKTVTEIEIDKLQAEIDLLPQTKKIHELKSKIKQLNKELNNQDDELVSQQMELWQSELTTETLQ